MTKLQQMELTCWTCNGEVTIHQYQYSVQTYQEELESEERAWDEIASEGPVQDLLVNKIIRSPAGKAGMKAGRIIGDVLDSLTGTDDLRGKDAYKCTQCGNTVFV